MRETTEEKNRRIFSADRPVDGEDFCERCKRKVAMKGAVWLEMDQRFNTFTDDGAVKKNQSQGWFVFHSACAKREREKHEKANPPRLKKAKFHWRGWYHYSQVHSFGSIFYHDDDIKNPKDYDSTAWGPFKTFSEAKKDAIGYFQADITEARRSINEIKAVKRSDIEFPDD